MRSKQNGCNKWIKFPFSLLLEFLRYSTNDLTDYKHYKDYNDNYNDYNDSELQFALFEIINVITQYIFRKQNVFFTRR